MSSINKVILIGRVGQDPEVRYLPSGDAVANFSLATSEQWKDKASGEKQEKTEWHRVVAYRKLAEVIGEWVKKGALLYIEGRLQTNKWQDRDGHDRYTTEIAADTMQMLGGRRDEETGGQRQAAPRPAASKPAPKFADMDDDVPF